MKLIDKAALVAEIEKRRDSFYSLSKSCEKGTPAKVGFYAQAQTLEGILSFLDNIEVKEVDLEKEMDEWRHNHFCGARDDKGAAGEWLTRKSQLDIAKHFYELGVKEQKGEEE